MITLKERYLARRAANVIIQDAPPIVETKKPILDTVMDGIRYTEDSPDDIYYDAIDAAHIIFDLFDDIGLSPDRNYSVAEISGIRNAVERVLGGER